MRATGPGGIPSAPGSFSGGFSGFEDGACGPLHFQPITWGVSNPC